MEGYLLLTLGALYFFESLAWHDEGDHVLWGSRRGAMRAMSSTAGFALRNRRAVWTGLLPTFVVQCSGRGDATIAPHHRLIDTPASRRLLAASRAQFVMVLVVIPLAVVYGLMSALWLALALVAGALHIAIVILAIQASRAAGVRFTAEQIVALALSPVDAICAPRKLCRATYRDVDLVDLYRTFASPAVFLAWSWLEVVDRPDREPQVREALAEAGLAEAFAAPPDGIGDGDSFCPRCRFVYRAAIATCADCGTALLAWRPTGPDPVG